MDNQSSFTKQSGRPTKQRVDETTNAIFSEAGDQNQLSRDRTLSQCLSQMLKRTRGYGLHGHAVQKCYKQQKLKSSINADGIHMKPWMPLRHPLVRWKKREHSEALVILMYFVFKLFSCHAQMYGRCDERKRED